MGLNSNSKGQFVLILYEAKVIQRNLFTLCFANNGGYFSTGGINTLYHDPNDTIAYVPLIRSRSFYVLQWKSLSVYGLQEDQSTIFEQTTALNMEGFIDSGTTLSYFPYKIYNSFLENFKTFCSLPGKCISKSTYTSIDKSYCFIFNDDDDDDNSYLKFLYSFPTLNFKFSNEVGYVWYPKNYLYKDYDDSKGNGYCIGVICIINLLYN